VSVFVSVLYTQNIVVTRSSHPAQGRTHVEAGCGLGHTRFFNFFLIYIPRQQKKEKKKKAVRSYFEYEVDH
jgi:hypothetical protein